MRAPLSAYLGGYRVASLRGASFALHRSVHRADLDFHHRLFTGLLRGVDVSSVRPVDVRSPLLEAAGGGGLSVKLSVAFNVQTLVIVHPCRFFPLHRGLFLRVDLTFDLKLNLFHHLLIHLSLPLLLFLLRLHFSVLPLTLLSLRLLLSPLLRHLLLQLLLQLLLPLFLSSSLTPALRQHPGGLLRVGGAARRRRRRFPRGRTRCRFCGKTKKALLAIFFSWKSTCGGVCSFLSGDGASPLRCFSKVSLDLATSASDAPFASREDGLVALMSGFFLTALEGSPGLSGVLASGDGFDRCLVGE
ncbi:hypothetical protein EYF80_048708 [Liparis tanakae]|uniref:Uncharacterized protein n=1 Tax=Liparis tanakae TaxID=230148 RepID=A0A4Z2FJI4_9TELE|nr:hypothetical protein EYF80_048708 [Liparis tanakae]